MHVCLSAMSREGNDRHWIRVKRAYCECVQGKTATNYTLHGHRDAGCTDCPGQKLYDLIRTWPHYAGKLPHNCSAQVNHDSRQSTAPLDFW